VLSRPGLTKSPNRSYIGVHCGATSESSLRKSEAVIGNCPCLPEKVAGGGARREGWQEGLWCTHVAAVARAAGDALAHSGHPLGNGPVQCVVACPPSSDHYSIVSSGWGLQLRRALQAVKYPRAHILTSPVRPSCLTCGYSSPHLKNKHHRRDLLATRAAPQLSAAPPLSTGVLCLPVARWRHSGCPPHRRSHLPPMAVAQRPVGAPPVSGASPSPAFGRCLLAAWCRPAPAPPQHPCGMPPPGPCYCDCRWQLPRCYRIVLGWGGCGVVECARGCREESALVLFFPACVIDGNRVCLCTLIVLFN